MPITAKMLSVSDLTPDAENARLHDDRNLEAIKSSLERFGQQKPIVVDSTMSVVAGNGTLEAAKMLGWTKISAVQTSLTKNEATAFAIADNRTTDLSQWDDAQMLKMVKQVNDDLGVEAVSAAGWTDDELQAIREQLSVELETPSNNPSGFSKTLDEYESASVRSLTFHFTIPQYEKIVEAFGDLMNKKEEHSHTGVIIAVLRDQGYEIPEAAEEED
tara:strand:- start:4987 stop:5637 length:651 start_codon:yes stop_codon:yes gene_type:complete